jgi:hypothetical protein
MHESYFRWHGDIDIIIESLWEYEYSFIKDMLDKAITCGGYPSDDNNVDF